MRSILPMALVLGALVGRPADRPCLGTINGISLTMDAYNHFLGDARSNVIAELAQRRIGGPAAMLDRELDGRPAREVVKARALDAATEYYVLVSKATELGLTTPRDEPLFGDNMARRKINGVIYGPSVLSERIVISRYLDALEAGMRKRLETSLAHDELEAIYRSTPALPKVRYGVLVRKIYRGYQPSSKERQRRVMLEILRALRAGSDFTQLAARYSEPIRENGWVQVDELGQQWITGRAVEDTFLRKTFLDLEPGELRGVADAGKGFYIVKCERVDERQRTFAEAKEMLIDEKMKHWIGALKATAHVELNEPAYGAITVN